MTIFFYNLARKFFKLSLNANIRTIHDDSGKEVKNPEDFDWLVNGDFVMILADESEKWNPPHKTLLTTLLENGIRKSILTGDPRLFATLNEREILFILSHLDPNEESKYIQQVRCAM